MAKTLPKVMPPRRARDHRFPSAPGYNPRAMRVAGMMRFMLITFWVVVMSLVWLPPNYSGLFAQLFETAWFSVICGGGLFVLHRFKRKSIREQRRSSGCCLECGYDLRGSLGGCPECGAGH